MRAEHDAAEKHKPEASDEATSQEAPTFSTDRGFGAFGSILISFVVALLGTTAVVVVYDVSWVWSLVIFIVFGVTTTAALIGLVYLKEK